MYWSYLLVRALSRRPLDASNIPGNRARAAVGNPHTDPILPRPNCSRATRPLPCQTSRRHHHHARERIISRRKNSTISQSSMNTGIPRDLRSRNLETVRRVGSNLAKWSSSQGGFIKLNGNLQLPIQVIRHRTRELWQFRKGSPPLRCLQSHDRSPRWVHSVTLLSQGLVVLAPATVDQHLLLFLRTPLLPARSPCETQRRLVETRLTLPRLV